MDFIRKPNFMDGVYFTDTTQVDTYSIIVSRDTVRIVLTVSELNEPQVKIIDIGNTYMNAETD